jgi:hypothetical protein
MNKEKSIINAEILDQIDNYLIDSKNYSLIFKLKGYKNNVEILQIFNPKFMASRSFCSRFYKAKT